MPHFDFIGAFMVGLLGAGHCLGMCGPIAGIITLQLKDQSLGRQLPYIALYNLGRISSYTLIGGIAAGSAAWLSQIIALEHGLGILRLLAGLLIILTGLHLLSLFSGITKIEVIGKPIWRLIQPLTSKLLPLSTPLAALPFGFLWGWLPCGLVYTMLSWSLSSGSVAAGAATMAAFGLGTLLPMLFIGIASEKVKQLLNRPKIKLFVGLSLISYGVYIFYQNQWFFLYQ